ncbi:protein AF-10 [Anoplophora glabripennis]|nr:protein AF-10 [Anoplophora glabripennis]
MREMVGGCCVCSDDRGWSENPLVYCDGQSCTVAVHQACYGIVTVPTGPWYCRKCESQERSVKVKCELCPSKYGALKRTDNSGWAHVVCALYIPEVRFGNVTTMEPIQLQLIPAERFNKVCYICEEKGKASNSTVGACMQCNKAGCKQQFHVTCAQGLGLLCEEAGNYLDNVKYCGYCQHHYSKLKKGGNVKTIPPYKPVSNESHNSDSNSEKEAESGLSKNNTSPPSGSSSKKKSSVGSKSAPSSKTSSKSSSSSQQKTVHNHTKNSDKSKVSSSKSAKSEDSVATDAILEGKPEKKESKSEPVETEQGKDPKEGKVSKKRKANSRTPTPVSVVTSEVSAVVTAISTISTSASTTSATSVVSSEKKNTAVISENSSDKPKKAKVETTQSIITNQPVVALTSISTIKDSSPVTTFADIAATSDVTHSSLPTQSIIQTAQTQSQSLVVSVPLVNTSLSPHPSIINPPIPSVLPAGPITPERSNSVGSAERSTSVISTDIMTGGNSNQGILTSEMSGGGLKITYEKQVDSINTEVDMELELEPSPPAAIDVPVKRGRSQSQSNEKSERSNRGKRRNGSNSMGATMGSGSSNTLPKRTSRSRHVTPPPPNPPGAFAAISQSQIKDSPPSSPSSESQSIPPSTSRGRTKGRKSAPAAVNAKDSKDIKLFQNGLTAPHMLGNQLNPNSNMHSKMTDHLNSELEAHSIFNPNENNSNLVGPQLHHRVVQSARASSTGSSTTSGGSGLSSMLGGGGGNIPQTLDQLLERQWEQGSQFLMEQAQHFDIASLLSCLHQLRAENLRLEEHVASLLQRRDHLLAVNARLAIPLTGQPAAPQSNHPHTVNNIHPSVAASHGDVARSSRHSGSNSGYPSHPQGSAQHPPVENGLPPEAYPQNPHRSPAGSQPSPTVRW